MMTQLSRMAVEGLTRETKQRIKSWVQELRRTLEEDFTRQLKRNGIDAGKPLQPERVPDYLTEEEKRARVVIVATIQRDCVNEAGAGTAAYVRECAYTLLNRLVGLKCMEARGIFFVDGEATEAVTTRPEYGARSRLLWQMRDESRDYRTDETRLWRDGLTRAFRAVTQDIAVLFDPDNEYSQVWPTHRVLMEAVAAINDAFPPEIYASPDFLGWVYQFFNADEKEQIRKDTGGKPRTSHELAVLNQFYTPDWIVKFLVDNTLGRVWLRMHPDTRLRERINYLVPNTGEDQRAPLKAVSEVRLLDPACGTMHFGQYAYGLFYEMYLEEMEKVGTEGWPAAPSVVSGAEIPAAILAQNLYGIDIDQRAVQIAALTLLLTMKEQAQAHGLEPQAVKVRRMNLVCADAVNLGEAEMEEFIRSLDPMLFGGDEPLRRAVRAVWQGLEHVAELGSLVQVGEEVERALSEPVRWRMRFVSPAQLKLSDSAEWGESQQALTAEDRATAREHLEDALAAYARRHIAAEDINRRFFVQETEKAVHLLDLLRQKYDAVVMNPPYGEFVSSVKSLVSKIYPRTKNDIYAAFIERSAQLLLEAGYLGALTSRTFLNLCSFAKLREEILLKERPPVAMLDLGFNILDGATVETAATILAASPALEATCVFFRLTKLNEERKAFFEIALTGSRHDIQFSVPLSQFALVPGAPLAYWASNSLRAIFKELPSLQPAFARVAVGMQTSDDGRFVRQWWEIACDKVPRKWVRFAKGGDYSRFYYDFDLVVNWANEGEELKRWVVSNSADPGTTHWSRNIRNTAYYFREGLTYTCITVKGFNVRHLPDGCVFAHKGPAIFVERGVDKWFILGVLNSALIQGLLLMLTPSRSYEVGVIQRLPFAETVTKRIGDLARAVHDLKAAWDMGNAVSTRFTRPWILQAMERSPSWKTLSDLLIECLEWEEQDSTECQHLLDGIDDAAYQLYGIASADRQHIEWELGTRPVETVWPQMEGKSREQRRMEHVQRLLSYLVKAIVEADEDGIVPLVPCGEEPPLVARVRSQLDLLFGIERGHAIETEINNELGRRTDVETWLVKQYFNYHCHLYKRRPIYWHITSEDGSFGALVHYHRFTRDRLAKLRSHYLYDGFIKRLQSEIGRLRGDNSSDARERLAKLEQNLEAARALDEKLRQIQEGEYPIRVPWKSEADQPKGWQPDIDDGVKVNIAPFEAAGVLAVKKVV